MFDIGDSYHNDQPGKLNVESSNGMVKIMWLGKDGDYRYFEFTPGQALAMAAALAECAAHIEAKQ